MDDLVEAAAEALRSALDELKTGRSINSTPGAAMLVTATAYALAVARGSAAAPPSLAAHRTEVHHHGLFG
jgi:hypothetical protein